MIFLVAAAVIGAGLTAAFMMPFGIVIAILSMPFGGSLCALLAGLYLAGRRGSDYSIPREASKRHFKRAA
ncbi:hypothetical protein [Microvirga massiliensis]|uniref:hypothetical protein n=1 Tax=Microvirga massiliensis TaxID=1033741 RepID=UPI00062B6EC6|nr:hypothetical protein [Microvirga massiliensis]